jgi:hypothetical protein
MALTVHILPNKASAFDSIAPHSSFGIGRGFAAMVGIFAVMLALTILGGHLRASWRRKRGEGRHYGRRKPGAGPHAPMGVDRAGVPFAVLRLLGLEVGTLDGWQPALHGALAVNVYASVVVLTG